MTNDDLSELALAIEIEAKCFGRVLSAQRALEIAKEIRRYDEAICQMALPVGIDMDPGEFLDVLVNLARP